ncbi:protein disulfide-isomerase A6 homolog [Amphiura filiformis]|uniref:protein disulfide-isomerase A6 homolog n=1 Tax=Amphiura filiformis TaxID=82378 RepID=UPI003B20D479
MERGIAVLLVACIGVASAMYGPKSDVVTLTDANFNDKVVGSDDVWMVEFYAPWCGHCKALEPEWDKAATALKGVVKVGAIDCDTHKSLPGQYGVRGFPTIKIFGLNKKSPQDYQGARTAQGIVDEAMKTAKKVVSDRLSGKGGSSGGSSGGGGGGGNGGGKKPGNKADVVELTDANFEELVLNSKEHWLVEFFAPWCGHCQRLAPEWASAATELKGKFNLGALDATEHTVMAGRYGVRGYPTIKYFPNGPKTQSSAEDYNGGRTAADIISWASDKAAESMPAPEVMEIIDESVIKEQCDERPLCVVSVLPDILDTGAEGRNKYLDMLKDIGDQYKKKSWGWVWTAPGFQNALEESLGMGGFGYPAMAVVNSRKGKFSILKGSFSSDGIREHLRAVGVGRGSTEPVRGGWPPKVVKAEPWDGKDGQLPEEEDIDLSDFDMDEDEGKDEL